jgi:lysozyme
MAGQQIPGPLGMGRLNYETFDEGTQPLGRTRLPGLVGMNIDDYGYSNLNTNTGPCWFSGGAMDTKTNVAELSFGENGMALLKQVETLRLSTYDDQTGKECKEWTAGATIGYGHLISKTEWPDFKDGILESAAEALLKKDLKPFVDAVKKTITVTLKQNEFDALVIFAFNVGATGFKGSSVAKMVNDPMANTGHADLETAWKAWNKSQGKIMNGLNNRRNCEWKIYTLNIYEKW